MVRELYSTKFVLEAFQNITRDVAKIFSKFGAAKGFCQISLNEENKDLTTLSLRLGDFDTNEPFSAFLVFPNIMNGEWMKVLKIFQIYCSQGSS